MEPLWEYPLTEPPGTTSSTFQRIDTNKLYFHRPIMKSLNIKINTIFFLFREIMEGCVANLLRYILIGTNLVVFVSDFVITFNIF